MGTKERRDREKLALRDKILDAARELFLTKGYEAVTMREVADKIEYSATAIYLHFKDKDALFQEICRCDFSRLAVALRELAAITDPVERIRAIGKAYLEFGKKYPNHYRLMFLTVHPVQALQEDVELKRGVPEEDAYAFLKTAVAEAIAGGRFRPEATDADLVSQVLWAGVHGIAALEITHLHDEWVDWRPFEQRSQLMLDSLIRGLLQQGSER